jgi:hypothetical protein
MSVKNATGVVSQPNVLHQKNCARPNNADILRISAHPTHCLSRTRIPPGKLKRSAI